MKSLDFGQLFQTLANIGVIAGIVFLAVEIQQNNELMEAEARFTRLSASKEAFNIQSTNGELAEIIVKVNNNESLTEVERYRFQSSHMRFLMNMEWIFREMPAESPERNYLERQMTEAMASELRRQMFLERIDHFDSGFVSWIEDNILSH